MSSPSATSGGPCPWSRSSRPAGGGCRRPRSPRAARPRSTGCTSGGPASTCGSPSTAPPPSPAKTARSARPCSRPPDQGRWPAVACSAADDLIGEDQVAQATLRLAQDPDADALLSRDPLALVMGMLLDQQFPLEWAFRAPWRLAQRMERTSLDAAELADWDPDAFVKLMAGPPALHRYPASMAVRVQALCRIVVDQYGGDAAAIWRTAATGKELAAPYGEDGSRRSAADVTDPDTLAEVRAFKQAAKQAAKGGG